jgi:hypothetical protein
MAPVKRWARVPRAIAITAQTNRKQNQSDMCVPKTFPAKPSCISITGIVLRLNQSCYHRSKV